MSNTKTHISVLMMVKNETKRLHVTLNSIKGFANSLVLFDTGSTDNTLDIARKFCEENKIPLRLKQGEFIDFSTSRNVSLDFADTFDDIDYLLLMDCNDELKSAGILRKVAEEFKNKPTTAFLICQVWLSNVKDSYYNIRLIKPRCKWRYYQPVHEYIKTEGEFENEPVVKLQPDIILYQDRNQDDDKSSKRFIRDKELLLKEYEKNPTEPRTIFYLAQTLSCLNEFEESFKFYELRTKLEGFHEEIFHAYLRSGDFSQKLGKDWYAETMPRYLKAFERETRVEPLVRLSEYYNKEKNFHLSYTFIRTACELPYPENCILFIDKLAYDYKRWHLMGICAYYVGKKEEGKKAVLQAIENGSKHSLNVDIDRHNLKFYEETSSSSTTATILPSPSPQKSTTLPEEILTKKKYLDNKIEELKKSNPNLTEKQRHTKALMNWKNERRNQK